tara:strand:+ start:178 stop:972 length:795 start_codon:yes stop_codon:yes gene_type:complete
MKISVFFVFVFFVACGTSDKTNGEVIARVNNETLTKKDLFFLAGNRVNDVVFFSRETNKWVENKLLYNAAISIGLDKDLALVKERDVFYENLLISSFIKIQTEQNIKTTKKEVSDYYLKNKESFKRTDDEMLIKHFIFPTKKEANIFKKELNKKKPKVDVEKLLNNQQVETKTIRKGGVGSGLLSFVFSGTVGEILGPKNYNSNFHLFQVLQKHKKGSYLGLERVYDEIYQRLYKEKEIMVLRGLLDSLYLESDVFVSQEPLVQ